MMNIDIAVDHGQSDIVCFTRRIHRAKRIARVCVCELQEVQTIIQIEAWDVVKNVSWWWVGGCGLELLCSI